MARRRSPLLLAIGIGTMIGGLVLSGLIAFLTLDGLVIFLPGSLIPYLGNVVYFSTGLAMVIGAAFGLWQLAREMVDR